MTSELYDELYPKLSSLIGIKANFNVFYNSWWTDKCLNYKGDKLSDYYDIFFSRFVTYNSLYNTITYSKESFGLLKKKYSRKNKIVERGDKEKATKLMVRQISNSELQILLSNSVIVDNTNKLVEILTSRRFAIIHKSGQQVPADDLLLIAKLKHPENQEKFLGILELLYNVRCNLFHGAKGYESDQIELLELLNEIIFHIVDALYNSFKAMMDNLIRDTKIKIKKFK